MRVLVVDDIIDMRHVMIQMLRSIGYDSIDEATDGLQAIKMLSSNKYDLVITDLYMPKMDGLRLLKSIRSSEKLSNLPVMMITGEASKETIQSIIKAKVTGFIVKPFNGTTLRAQLNKINLLPA